MTGKFVDRLPAPEIAGVVIPWFTPADRPTPDRLRETSGLVEALGCQLGFVRPEQIRKKNPSFLLSGGILDRMAGDLEEGACTLAVVDGALSPVQQRNLEKRLGMKVIDRTGLILKSSACGPAPRKAACRSSWRGSCTSARASSAPGRTLSASAAAPASCRARAKASWRRTAGCWTTRSSVCGAISMK